jgi:hypothetical protein
MSASPDDGMFDRLMSYEMDLRRAITAINAGVEAPWGPGIEAENFMFTLNWIADGEPDRFLSKLRMTTKTLESGTLLEQLQSRVRLLEFLKDAKKMEFLKDGRKSARRRSRTHCRWDAFVSVSGVDTEFAKVLVEDLKGFDCSVWFYANRMDVGDSIASKLNAAIRASRCCVAIISPSYLREGSFTMLDLEAFFSEENRRSKQLIIPLVYKMGLDDVRRVWPVLSGRACVVVSDASSIETISTKVFKRIQGLRE